jgi:integrase
VFLDHDTAGLLREHCKTQLKVRLKAGEAWADNDLAFCQDNGQPWHPDHVSKRFKKLAAQAGVPVVTLHEGGRHTANSLMQDAGGDQELRMREVGHADKSVNDRYTHPLEQAHLAASEQTAALVRKAGKASWPGQMFSHCSHQRMEQRSHSLPGTTPPQLRCGGAGGARTHDRQIMSPLL